MSALRLSSSVGKSGRNNVNDVHLVIALINVYHRKNGLKPLPLSDKNNAKVNEAITNFQSNHLQTANPDGRIDANGKSFKALKRVLDSVFTKETVTPPTSGVVTWDSEGTEGGRFHSRKLHVPSSASGLTVGRGYDLKLKSAAQVKMDLTRAKLEQAHIDVLAKAVGLSGSRAERFIVDNDLLDFQVTPQAQLTLFNISYALESSEVIRISSKKDVINLYGELQWDTIHYGIKDILVDLKFRGDYTPAARRFIQEPAASNNLESFKKLISDQTRWKQVPADRFSRRSKFINNVK